MKRLSELPDRTLEQLSAYLDGELSAPDAARLESALQADPVLRSSLEELRSVTRLMAALPPKRAPRSFTLRPSMVGKRPGRLTYPRLQLATALATLVFLMTYGVDLLTAGAPLARQASLAAEAPMPLAAAPEMDALEGGAQSPLGLDARLLATVTPLNGQDQEPATETAFAEVLPSLMLDAATEAPAAEEALPGTGGTSARELGTEAAAEAAPSVTCEEGAVAGCVVGSAADAAQPPALSLLAPEPGSSTPEAEFRAEKSVTEPPALAEVPPSAASLPVEAQPQASQPAPLPASPPAPAEVPPDDSAADSLSVQVMETPAVTSVERFAEPQAGGWPDWLTPLRILQVGLALLTLVLASLTIWARQQL
jgi:hypothetical protein